MSHVISNYEWKTTQIEQRKHKELLIIFRVCLNIHRLDCEVPDIRLEVWER